MTLHPSVEIFLSCYYNETKHGEGSISALKNTKKNQPSSPKSSILKAVLVVVKSGLGFGFCFYKAAHNIKLSRSVGVIMYPCSLKYTKKLSN